jgi:hypothetical protein
MAPTVRGAIDNPSLGSDEPGESAGATGTEIIVRTPVENSQLNIKKQND